MTFAVLSESAADESAIRVLLGPLVAAEIAMQVEPVRFRGWPAVLKLLPPVIKHFHYHTAVDGLIVVVDSDDSTPHGGHEPGEPADCRLCRLTSRVAQELVALTPVPGKPSLRTAIGLCIPAIEAWYLCGIDATVTEAAWTNGRRSGQPPYSRVELKRRVYGTPIPVLEAQKEIAVLHAERLAADLNLLDTCFPAGCGVMLDSVRAW